MKSSEVIDSLTRGVPKQAEWSKGEAYGPFCVNKDSEISKVLYCVTPTRSVIQHFKKNNYDLLVSHHPFVVNDGIPQVVLHTALDCCDGGLNDQWRDAIGILNPKHFDGTLGWHGDIDPISFPDLIKKCEKFVGAPLIGQTYSEIETIKSVVICSGLGGMVTDLALQTKADCYILGEATEAANQMGFKAVIETGHTLSERCGINLIRSILPNLEIDLAPLEADYFGREHFLGSRRFGVQS